MGALAFTLALKAFSRFLGSLTLLSQLVAFMTSPIALTLKLTTTIVIIVTIRVVVIRRAVVAGIGEIHTPGEEGGARNDSDRHTNGTGQIISHYASIRQVEAKYLPLRYNSSAAGAGR